MTYISVISRHFPRRRVARQEIWSSYSWKNAGRVRVLSGMRPICSSDEDPVTLAVEAARRCLTRGGASTTPSSMHLALLAPLYSGRRAANVFTEALSVGNPVTEEYIGSRSGTSVLIHAIRQVQVERLPSLAVAAAQQRPMPGSEDEILVGDGAAAVLIDTEPGIAKVLGVRSSNVDLPTRFGIKGANAGYEWEGRWIADVAILQTLVPVVELLLAHCGVLPKDVKWVAWHAPSKRAVAEVSSQLGLSTHCEFVGADQRSINFGTATHINLLADVLSVAKAGDIVLLINVDQGCDALLFEARGNPSVNEIDAHDLLAEGISTSYVQYLSIAGIIDFDRGLRSEVDNMASLSLRHRNSRLLTGLNGGYCSSCMTVQIPLSAVCVSCRSLNTQRQHSFAHKQGILRTWSADHLAATDEPPSLTGLVDFDGGGRLMMDLTDFGEGEIGVGKVVKASFRVRNRDINRGFTNYFWKATPFAQEAL